MSVIIKSGATSDTLTVDPTSKASRVTKYDTRGNAQAFKATYSASTDPTVAAPASSTAPFFVLYGSASKTLRVQRIRVTGATTATLALQGFTLRKYSTAPSGGTPVTLTQTPHDSASSAATASLCQVYTAAPTAGTSIGALSSVRCVNKSTTVVDGSPSNDTFLDIPVGFEGEPCVLRGTTQGIGLVLHVATATTVSVSVVWTEE